jgi:ribonuclease P/MRP protein subunit RPP1
MMYTDACVHPYSNGDTSVCRFALEAQERGFDSIVTTGNGRCPGVPDMAVLRGALIKKHNANDAIRFAGKAKGSADLIIVCAGDLGFNRAVLSYPGIHILHGIAGAPKGAFDQVTARFAAERNTAINLSLSPLIGLRGIERQRVLQRYADVLRLQRRYSFPLTLSSDAHSYTGLRTVRDFINLCELFGMEEHEVRQSLAAIEQVLRPREPVEVLP